MIYLSPIEELSWSAELSLMVFKANFNNISSVYGISTFYVNLQNVMPVLCSLCCNGCQFRPDSTMYVSDTAHVAIVVQVYLAALCWIFSLESVQSVCALLCLDPRQCYSNLISDLLVLSMSFLLLLQSLLLGFCAERRKIGLLLVLHVVCPFQV